MAHFTLSWVAPTTREDGSPLIKKVYYRLFEEGEVIVDKIYETNFSVTVENPPPKLMYQLATVVESSGEKSALSDPLIVNFIKPLPPTGLKVSFDG